jgi:hypothetical protein
VRAVADFVSFSDLYDRPATATAFNAEKFCSDVLQPTDVTTTYVRSTGVLTVTEESITHVLNTVTDFEYVHAP